MWWWFVIRSASWREKKMAGKRKRQKQRGEQRVESTDDQKAIEGKKFNKSSDKRAAAESEILQAKRKGGKSERRENSKVEDASNERFEEDRKQALCKWGRNITLRRNKTPPLAFICPSPFAPREIAKSFTGWRSCIFYLFFFSQLFCMYGSPSIQHTHFTDQSRQQWGCHLIRHLYVGCMCGNSYRFTSILPALRYRLLESEQLLQDVPNGTRSIRNISHTLHETALSRFGLCVVTHRTCRLSHYLIFPFPVLFAEYYEAPD